MVWNGSLMSKVMSEMFELIRYAFIVPYVAHYAFKFAVSMKMINSRIVNQLSSHTLGIYLAHGSTVCTPLIFYGILDIQKDYLSILFPAKTLINVAEIYFVCLLIDILRTNLFEKRAVDFFNSKYNYFIKKYRKQ